MPKSRPDDITPVEVPLPNFEGPTDARLKGAALDPRLSGTEQAMAEHHESERPVLPADVTAHALAVAFKALAQQHANQAAKAIQEQRRTNDLLALLEARVKLLPTAATSSPRGYRLLWAAVVTLGFLHVFELMLLHQLMQSIVR